MICNVGKKEKRIRIVIGIVALVLGYYVSPWFYLVAVIGFVTAAIGYCPVTHLMGINTCASSETSKKEETKEVDKEVQ